MPLGGLLAKHGSPLLIFEPEKVRTQYSMLQTMLPMVEHHFAIKALRHPAAVAAVDDCGGYFDVMTNGDIDMVRAQGIAPERCIHTNPIKKPSDIAYARGVGLTTFVVDNANEVDKLAAAGGDVQVLVRLSFPNPQAKSDLSAKFGAPPDDAVQLVRHALQRGLTVAGFTLHVGSQIHNAQAYAVALTKTIALINRVQHELDYRLRVLDIGGGMPVDYLEPAPHLQEIAQAITPLIEPLKDTMRILSEPGRFIVAPSMTLISQIVGKNTRGGKTWYYIDDGVYGSYSSVIYEHVAQPIFALKELLSVLPLPLHESVVAGPTCDSADVVQEDCLLPELAIGDYVISPMMGAYTAVSATDYNGIPRTPIAVLDDPQPRAARTAAASRKPDNMAPFM
jgi:ornithine decarboxylase